MDELSGKGTKVTAFVSHVNAHQGVFAAFHFNFRGGFQLSGTR